MMKETLDRLFGDGRSGGKTPLQWEAQARGVNIHDKELILERAAFEANRRQLEKAYKAGYDAARREAKECRVMKLERLLTKLHEELR